MRERKKKNSVVENVFNLFFLNFTKGEPVESYVDLDSTRRRVDGIYAPLSQSPTPFPAPLQAVQNYNFHAWL
jgi:hypothetical protein